SGLITVRVTGEFAESTVSKILRLVESSGDRKARAEQFITRFARIYTPAVCAAAVLLAVVPSLFDGQWSQWIHRALTFLVISCPCALVISVPLTFFSGIGAASRKGILVKGANHLETLADLSAVVFDKTGTLTKGVFSVTAVHPAQGSEADLLETAALAESWSDHPISKSLQAAWGKAIDTQRVTGAEELAGHGVKALVDGRTVHAGNERLMATLGLTVAPCEVQGTVVHVARDGAYLGHIVISDEVKPTSAQAMADLKAAGVQRLIMLTGDRQAVAEDIAARLGLTEVHAQLLPEDKVSRMEDILGGGGKVAFCGDGINDAPVLRRADVGIAMGAMGSDAAIEAADVVLMDDDPLKLPLAIRIARRTMRIARENIVFALGVKAIVLLMGALGHATMWLAVFADVGVAMLAILNAMRAMRIK
ncbi:MAG: heavy metal translocating P-type ATPase, partial [Aristaeellaceae bacterium]